MRRLVLLLAALGCASAQPRPAACVAPAESVEVAQVQVGWNALATGLPRQPEVIDLRRAETRYQPDAERLARTLLERCEKGEPLAPLQQQYSEAAPGTAVIDGSSKAPFREAALCLPRGGCTLFQSAIAYHVIKRIN